MKKWEENIRKVTPYTPGEQPKLDDIIKLNTNENPYPPAPGVIEALRSMDTDRLRKYPDPTADQLIQALSDVYHLSKEQIFVGVGSDDVISMCFLTFFNGKKPVLFPDISYSFYKVWADVYRIPYETVALQEDFTINPADYDRDCGGIIFPNPNAPTGALLTLDAVEQIVSAHPGEIVIVDEAYIDFGGESALPLIDKYDNVLVVQTFSKSRSMAGMRIGCAFGAPALIKYLNDVKYSVNSYTMNLPSLVAGEAAVRDEAYFAETTQKIIATRERFKAEMRRLGFTFPDSQANFIFAKHEKISAKQLFAELKEAKIFVRYFDQPRIDNYLRITIGTDEEMDRLLAFLERRVAAL